MKLLIFTDTHGSELAERKVIEKAKKHKPDLILFCGDMSIFMNNIDIFFKKMNKLKIKIYALHGNHEEENVVAYLCRKYKHFEFIHEKAVRAGNAIIMGYGGGGFSERDDNFKNSEGTFIEEIKKCKGCKKILMLHQPPFNSGIDAIGNANSGNKTTKKFILKNKIDYVIAGHIHETSGLECRKKDTIYINPGPFGRIINL